MNKLLLLAEGGGGVATGENQTVYSSSERRRSRWSHGVFLSPVLSSLVVPEEDKGRRTGESISCSPGGMRRCHAAHTHTLVFELNWKKTTKKHSTNSLKVKHFEYILFICSY